MFESLSNLIFQLTYTFSTITISNVIDIVLVAAVFFVILQTLHRTRALQLMGGVIILGVFGAALFFLLPFDTLNWLLRWERCLTSLYLLLMCMWVFLCG